jgi:hypothetical protein
LAGGISCKIERQDSKIKRVRFTGETDMMKAYDEAVDALQNMSQTELKALRGVINEMLADMPHGWVNVVERNGNRYLYWRWREDGKTRSRYLGKEDGKDPEPEDWRGRRKPKRH